MLNSLFQNQAAQQRQVPSDDPDLEDDFFEDEEEPEESEDFMNNEGDAQEGEADGYERSQNAGSDGEGEDPDADAVPLEGQMNPFAENDINTDTFSILELEQHLLDATNDSWRQFINTAESREAAGEAIFAAIFEGAPSLQSLFTTPRAVQAMRFMNFLNTFVGTLEEPPKLKAMVETLGFAHMQLEVTKPRVVMFRSAILDLFAVELGEKFSMEARIGWTRCLNYIGGAFIFIRAHFSERINVLLESWKAVNNNERDESKLAMLASADTGERAKQIMAKETKKDQKEKKNGGLLAAFGLVREKKIQSATVQKNQMSPRDNRLSPRDNRSPRRGRDDGEATLRNAANDDMDPGMGAEVPTTYNEMFKFNAAVMGIGRHLWLNEVLACFHNIVVNVSNPARLQEECEILVLRISRVVEGKVTNFADYKSCMLASLRALLPKDWSTDHEVAWSWLWQNVETLLARNMGNPLRWEKALARFYNSLDDDAAFEMRKDIYARFFAQAPAGQDFFKQSNTYLHFIAERNMAMTIDLYRDPVNIADDISALGLRHVGYGIPTELFGPFVNACVEAIMSICDDMDAVESFRWSLGLIAKMLTRTINEGSTIVMKAVNGNSTKQLNRAISCAPRSERASWLLMVQVGTQDISPLSWAIESGALEAAGAIISDLLTIRADRDRYYYSMDQLFKRHPDIVKRLCNDAPVLLPKLLDGLIWRSRTTEAGYRRVNYYVRHLIVAENNSFSQTLSWFARTKDPKIVCHPTIVFSSDTVWSEVACRVFLYRKSWLLLTLVVFITGQSIFKHTRNGEDPTSAERWTIFIFRCFIYLLNLTQLLYSHLSRWVKAFRASDLRKVAGGYLKIPQYLDNWQDIAGFALMAALICMLSLEPILHCSDENEGHLFNEHCKKVEDLDYFYSIFSMLAMFLYFGLLIDLAVVSTKVSAYVLVSIRMLSEAALFILVMSIAMLTFSSAISILKHEQEDFRGIHKGLLSLGMMTARMFGGEHYAEYEKDPVVLICVFLFLVLVIFFLLNLLIAQFTCSYEAVYTDMVGYARLERLQVIVLTMPSVRESRWMRFLDRMKFDKKIEFNAGDVGVSGGVQVAESASVNPTTVDMIRRFGGTTSPEMPWPKEDDSNRDDNDRLDRLEKLIQKTYKRAASGQRKGGPPGQNSSGDRKSVV